VEFYNRKNQKRFEIPSSGRGLLIEQLNKCCFLSLCYDFFFIRSANFFYKYCITFIICYWSNVCHGICSLTFILFDRPFWIFKTMIEPCHGIKVFTPEMQLTVGPVGPRGQNFRGSGKWCLCVRPNDRQTFLLLGAVKNQISVCPGYLLDP
jgi:hypothetical protein